MEAARPASARCKAGRIFTALGPVLRLVEMTNPEKVLERAQQAFNPAIVFGLPDKSRFGIPIRSSSVKMPLSRMIQTTAPFGR